MPGDRLRKELLELTSELIRIPSTQSRPDAIQRCSSFICDWFKRNDVSYQSHDCAGVPSISVLPQAGKAPIMLLAHFDVVEADDEGLFVPVQKDGCLFGRGAIDDKYAVAVSMVLFREYLARLKKQGLSQQHMPFGLLLTGDEEVGGFKGVGELGKTIEMDFFLALDGGNPKKVVTREKGILQFRLEAEGRAAHSARPWLGESAFDRLIDDYHRLRDLFATSAAGHWHNTLVLTNCHAGSGSTNVLPSRASANIDLRYTEQSDPDILIKTIRDTVSSTVIIDAREPVFHGGSSVCLELLLKHATGAVTGYEHGASDARFLSALGVPGVVWGADGQMSQHTSDEHVVISSMYDVYDSLVNFFLEYSQEFGTLKAHRL
ncbi:MAG: M20 family metallopeptidase [Desulfuromonadales bacterium]|nr:M20 family metallopeptidase [Desulfuromonadales bacterium]MBN2791007.1 M20 family metallopeptidase [Desulfuromonadales bacterium]